MKKLELKGGGEVPVAVSSTQWTLNLRNILQGLIIAAITPVIVVVQQTLDSGHLVFDWKAMGMAAIGGAVAYFIKKLPESSKVVIKKSDYEEARQ